MAFPFARSWAATSSASSSLLLQPHHAFVESMSKRKNHQQAIVGISSELSSSSSSSSVPLNIGNPTLQKQFRKHLMGCNCVMPLATEIVQVPRTATEVVREFYTRINNRELGFVEELVAENCVYEDLVFPKPFVGRQEIMDFFKKFVDTISKDLQFVIDDISSEDSTAVGVTWHLEWRGKPFPFSKGCSFYRCQIFYGKRQIVYARDSVEPATKPGDLALGVIKAITSLLEAFPQIAERF